MRVEETTGGGGWGSIIVLPVPSSIGLRRRPRLGTFSGWRDLYILKFLFLICSVKSVCIYSQVELSIVLRRHTLLCFHSGSTIIKHTHTLPSKLNTICLS